MITKTVKRLVMWLVVLAGLVLAPSASGAANLTSVTPVDHFVRAEWTLPGDDAAFVLDVSNSPSFPDELGTGTSEFVDPIQTSVTTTLPLPGGNYYARVGSFPCVNNPPCDLVYSNVVPVTIRSDAATLQSASLTGGVLSATWSLPSAASAMFLEVSRYLDRGYRGFADVVYETSLGFDETAFSEPVSLPPGLYYIHVATIPTSTLDLCLNVINGCAYEFSNIGSVRVGSASSGSQPAGAAGGAADKTVSLGAITAKSKQDIDKLSITLNAGEAVKVKLSGSVNVPGASKVYRFKSVSKAIGAGVKTKLSLKLPAKGRKAVKKALKRKKLKAKLTLVITDAAGNAQTKKYTVRLKR